MLRLVLAAVLAVAVIAPVLGTPPPVARAATTAPIDPLLSQQMAANPTRQLPVIVTMRPIVGLIDAANARLAQQAADLLRQHGTMRAALPLIGGAAGLVDAAGISALSAVAGVRYIAQDAQVTSHADPSTTLTSVYPQALNADRVWASGGSGLGVTVAVLDSGIGADADLMQPNNRILARVNLADQLPATSTDPGGHGTHVAGTIGGNGTRSAGQYVGIAPRVNLVDVRVLDANGRGSASSVILGVQWALEHRAQYAIRVLNLSLGAPPRSSYLVDPLAAAVEIAWMRGLVVVAASGNSADRVDAPGNDPYVITVGATDDRDSAAVQDDVLGWFSGWGTPPGSTAKPDLVAPGRKIVATRSPGSTLERLLPDHLVSASNGAQYLRLTGTSMATAVISGQVALLLERHPELTPDQVKAVLKSTARPFGQGSGSTPPRGSIGAGLGDAYAALSSGPRGSANRGQRPADGSATNLYGALYGQPLSWKDSLLGGVMWNLLTWATLSWDDVTWDNLVWDNIAWDNLAWDNLAWDNIAWDNLAWDNLAWDNIAWDGSRLD